MKGIRGERLSGEFQKEISAVLAGKLKDRCPAMSPIVSVTGADIAPDLKSAKIYISIYDTDADRAKQTFENICENAGFIRHELAHTMSLRTMPELRFYLDESMQYGEKIDRILSSLDKNDD